MLRVLLVLETSGGGSGRHVIDLSQELQQLGHEVHILFSGRRMEGWFGSELNQLQGVRHSRIDMHRSPHPADLISVKSIRKYIKTAGPFDVIHGHSSKGGALARIAALGLPGVRIYTPHALRTLDPSLDLIARQIYMMLEKTLGMITHGLIAVSEEEQEHAAGFGFAQKKLHLVHNGLRSRSGIPSREITRNRLELSNEAYVVGFVGRFVEQKAPEIALQAFELLTHDNPDTALIMMGDGNLSESLHAEAEKLGIEQKVIWLTGEEGCMVMPAFDTFIMTSLYEALPYVLIETAQAGLPIVSTPVGGTKALVKHKINGFIVPQRDFKRMGEALIHLANDSRLCATMSQASDKIAEHFTVSEMTQNTLNVYKRVLDKK